MASPVYNPVAPDKINTTIKAIARKSSMRRGIEAMSSYRSQFDSERQMMLAGIAMVPAARQLLCETVDNVLAQYTGFSPADATTLIIGGGLHAAIYAAVTHILTGRKVTVMERSMRPGGTFAVCDGPAWYLNSLNRPGLLGQPGQRQNLNYIPGAPVQVSDFTASEYPTNDDIAFIVRLMLAEHAYVYRGMTVSGIDLNGIPGRAIVKYLDGSSTIAKRVIDARGLGDPVNASNGPAIQSYPDFLASLASASPYRGLRRVAVVGGGDAGKTVLEALLGISPAQNMSVCSLDYIERIDWYAPNIPATCSDYRERERARYMGIGKYLPKDARDTNARVIVRGRARRIMPSLGTVLVSEQTYDRAIMATGYELPQLVEFVRSRPDQLGGYVNGYDNFHVVGPAAAIPFSSDEYDNGIANVAPNAAAIFRLANRTATLARKIEVEGTS